MCRTGNPNDQDESRGGILRPYPGRDGAPSCGLNNAAISTIDTGQQTLAEPQVSPADPLGELPENWEMAYTENGELYFIEYVPSRERQKDSQTEGQSDRGTVRQRDSQTDR